MTTNDFFQIDLKLQYPCETSTNACLKWLPNVQIRIFFVKIKKYDFLSINCVRKDALRTDFRPLGVQVGRMGCVPECGRNSNSRNVSCSQPSLHRQGAPSGRGAI